MKRQSASLSTPFRSSRAAAFAVLKKERNWISSTGAQVLGGDTTRDKWPNLHPIPQYNRLLQPSSSFNYRSTPLRFLLLADILSLFVRDVVNCRFARCLSRRRVLFRVRTFISSSFTDDKVLYVGEFPPLNGTDEISLCARASMASPPSRLLNLPPPGRPQHF